MKKTYNLIMPVLVLSALTWVGTQANAADMEAGMPAGEEVSAEAGMQVNEEAALAVDELEVKPGGTLAGVHKGKQGDPVLKPMHRHGAITLREPVPGHAMGTGDTEGGELKGVTHRDKLKTSHNIVPKP